jgi:hypothetical protein
MSILASGRFWVGSVSTTENRRSILYLLSLVWLDRFLRRIDNYVKKGNEKKDDIMNDDFHGRNNYEDTKP